MKPKTIAKLFGAVVEDDYGSPQRDATLPGWFRWYLDHMPVRENVYGTLIDIGLTGTQANVIIERIWPQVASIQQEAIDLAKAGNESGAIAKLNEAASLAERLAREAAEHERLLGRGIEPEPPRRMEERDMAAQTEKADWPRQVVERDNYILINDYLGADYAQANPELVETLVRIASDYLAARPDVAFDNLWAYTYDALKKMYPAREQGIEVGGSMMKAAVTPDDDGAAVSDGGELVEKDRYREWSEERAAQLKTLEDTMSYLITHQYRRAMADRLPLSDEMTTSAFIDMLTPEALQAFVANLERQTGKTFPSDMRNRIKEVAAEVAYEIGHIQRYEPGPLPVWEVISILLDRLPWAAIQSLIDEFERTKMWPETKAGGGMMEASTIAKMFGARERFEGPTGLLPFSEQVMKKAPLSYKDAVRELERYIDGLNLSPADRDKFFSDISDFWLWAEPRKTMYPDYTDALSKAKAWADQHYGPQKAGGGITPADGRTPEQHFGRIYPLLEKKDWPSEVVERDRYIIINDWMGIGFAETHPELVTVLKETAANHLAIHPDIDFDDLGAYVYEVLKAIWPPEKRVPPWKPIETKNEKTGGGIMPKLLSLRSILMAAASLGDLLSLLRKVKDPEKGVTAAIKKLEGMVAKYDEGAKLEDVNTATMKRILANLKKIKPTKDQPRTRVLRAVKLLEDLLKTKVSSAVLQASIVQVARILKAVEEPTEEVKDAIKLADQLAKSYEEGGPKKYGKVVSVEGMTKLLKMLEAIEEKPDPVVKAVAALKKLLGAEEEKAPIAPGERGELPSYGLAKLEAAIKPGVYRARLIRAGEALDGTTWPEEQLKIAFEKKLFEGVPVNAISYTGQYGPDIEYHLPLDTEIAGKVVGNQVGFIKDTSWDDEEHAGYGFVYITEAERRNLIDAMLEEGIDTPGMSIYADGMKDENDVVTGINGVTSMDLVTFPAADGAILSQALTASVKEWGEMRKKLRTMVKEDVDESVVAAVTPDAGGTSPVERGRKAAYTRQDVCDSIKGNQPHIYEGMQDVLDEASIDKDLAHRILDAETKKSCEALPDAVFSFTQLVDLSYEGEKKMIAALDSLIAEQDDRTTKTGGGIMSPTALEQRLDVVEKISQGLNERVAQADTDGMIETKLQASKLPEKVQVALRGQLLGKQLTEDEVDSFIKFQQGITDDLATELAATAHVTLGGGVLPGEGKDTLEGALTALFEKQK